MKIIEWKRVGYPVGVNDDIPVAAFDSFVKLSDSALYFFEQLYGGLKITQNNSSKLQL